MNPPPISFRVYASTTPQGYRLHLGGDLPASVEEAYGLIHRMSFFPPTHIWLGGKFIDISELPEVRVDGKVVLTNRRGFSVISS